MIFHLLAIIVVALIIYEGSRLVYFSRKTHEKIVTSKPYKDKKIHIKHNRSHFAGVLGLIISGIGIFLSLLFLAVEKYYFDIPHDKSVDELIYGSFFAFGICVVWYIKHLISEEGGDGGEFAYFKKK